jgi:hypothetical protein
VKWSLLKLAGAVWITWEGCSMLTRPGVALRDIQFAEGPFIARRGEDYFLHYRVAQSPGSIPPPRTVVKAKKEKDRGYYFFIGTISAPERGNVVERPLASDGLTEFARRGAMYWLDPDGSEIPLEVKNEPE